MARPLVALLAGLLLAAAAPSPARADGPGAAADLGEASAGAVALVVLNCFEFEPDVVRIVNGDTVHWHWADACQRGHTVTSSGTTLDPEEDLDRPAPTLKGLCFDSSPEVGGQLGFMVFDYFLNLTFAGTILRDVGTERTAACPLANSLQGTSGVVPYFCRFHGNVEVAGQGMRGAVVVGL